jgi:hypothetical protein
MMHTALYARQALVVHQTNKTCTRFPGLRSGLT